jgi:hypothetical protein
VENCSGAEGGPWRQSEVLQEPRVQLSSAIILDQSAGRSKQNAMLLKVRPRETRGAFCDLARSVPRSTDDPRVGPAGARAAHGFVQGPCLSWACRPAATGRMSSPRRVASPSSLRTLQGPRITITARRYEFEARGTRAAVAGKARHRQHDPCPVAVIDACEPYH